MAELVYAQDLKSWARKGLRVRFPPWAPTIISIQTTVVILNCMFKRIHHVAVICSDYQKSKKFYTETLGLEIIREVYREKRDSYKLDLKVGDSYQIEIFSFPNPPKRLSYPEASGLRHLAFEVDTIDKVWAELQQKGVILEQKRRDEITDKKFFFFHDPDGLPIEIYEK